MVLENLKDYPSEWAAIESIAPKIGCVPQTLHGWVRKHQIKSKSGIWFRDLRDPYNNALPL